jgi:hypothetical protein
LFSSSGLETFSKKREKKIQKRKKKKADARALQQSLLIPTLATRGSTAVHQPEIVTFVSHKKKNKAEKQEPSEDKSLETEEISMKQARFEVFKFGLNALSKKDRTEAKVALAIRLGAKPPKNVCLPYAELKAQRRQERAEQRQAEEENAGKLINRRPPPAAKKSAKGKKTAAKGGAAKAGGGSGGLQMGSFDGGMLRLSGKELAKLKGKKS